MMLAAYEEWLETVRGADSRVLLVHGCAYAALSAAEELLAGVKAGWEGREKFKDFLRGHCAAAATTAVETVNVNQMWTDAITAFRLGAFGETLPEWKRIFNVQKRTLAHAPMADEKDQHGEYVQRGWVSYTLHIEPNAFLEALRKFMRERNKTLPLEKGDLREQMSRKPYWSAKNGTWGSRQKFGGSAMCCWVIEVDKFPEMGYRHVTTADYLASRYVPREDGQPASMEDWVKDKDWQDPRKGELFAIIDAMESAAKKEEE